MAPLESEHMARPWRVHGLAPDFRLLDVWTIPIEADPARESFRDFLRVFVANGIATDSRLANALFRLRFALGKVFRLDPGPSAGLTVPGTSSASVSDRLTDEDRERDRSKGVLGDRPPLSANLVYTFEDEALLEIANRTIHALLHLGWIDAGVGAKKTATLAVYVKSRGWTSDAYMALIGPFRHLFVYPAWLARLGAEWERSRAAVGPAPSRPAGPSPG